MKHIILLISFCKALQDNTLFDLYYSSLLVWPGPARYQNCWGSEHGGQRVPLAGGAGGEGSDGVVTFRLNITHWC